jgi:hypothetical protein
MKLFQIMIVKHRTYFYRNLHSQLEIQGFFSVSDTFLQRSIAETSLDFIHIINRIMQSLGVSELSVLRKIFCIMCSSQMPSNPELLVHT